MQTILIKNADIITQNSVQPLLENYSVLLQDGVIARIGQNSSFVENYDIEIDAAGKIVMPGLINAHAHFYSAFARGIGGLVPSANFSDILNNLWWRLDKALTADDNYYSALTMLINCIKHGTTTIFDHHASPFSATGSLDLIAKAVNEAGLKACLCYETSDRDGSKIARDGLEENFNFLKKLNENPRNNLAASFGLHASFTLEDTTLAEVSRMISELGCGVHIHTAEDKSDQIACQQQHGQSVVERLTKFSLLNSKTILAHCVHINDKERELIKNAGSIAIHNPQSNANNAVGAAEIFKLHQNGILVGLGTDSMTMNMLEEIRYGIWSSHHVAQNPNVGFMELCQFLFENNSTIANRFFKVPTGKIAEGFAADLILIDYNSPTPITKDNLYGHLVFGLSQEMVDTTICGGKILMQNKKLCLDIMDEKEVMAKARECANGVWKRM